MFRNPAPTFLPPLLDVHGLILAAPIEQRIQFGGFTLNPGVFIALVDRQTLAFVFAVSVARNRPCHGFTVQAQADHLSLRWREDQTNLILRIPRPLPLPTAFSKMLQETPPDQIATIDLSSTGMTPLVDNGSGSPMDPNGTDGHVCLHIAGTAASAATGGSRHLGNPNTLFLNS